MPYVTPDRAKAPAVSPVPEINLPQMDGRILSGGAMVKVHDKRNCPVVQIEIVREGGMAELENPAVSRIYASMVREGSDRFNPETIAGILEFNGSWMMSSIKPHHHSIKLFALCRNLPEVLPVLADVVFSPTFPDNSLSTLRETAATKLEVMKRKVKFIADCECLKQSHGSGHPLVREITPEALRSVSREQLLGVANQWRHSPATIYVSGMADDRVMQLVENIFSPLETTRDSLIKTVALKPQCARSVHQIKVADASQSAVSMTLPAIPRTHPDYTLLHFTMTALGGYFGSRLMSNIREDKGYTYGISAGLMGQIDGGYIGISAECDNRFVEPLIDETRKEIIRLAECPPEGEELNRLRQAIASSMLEILETPFTVSDYYATMQSQGIPDNYFNNRIKLLGQLTPQMLAETTRKYLRPELLNITVAGS